MKNEINLIKIEWIENQLDEPTLLLHLSATSNRYTLFSDQFHRQWPASFLLSIGIEKFETEQHADFTLTRFVCKDIVCLLTIDNISESVWITPLSQAIAVLTALKKQIEEALQ